jgi:hypothetical protein
LQSGPTIGMRCGHAALAEAVMLLVSCKRSGAIILD